MSESETEFDPDRVVVRDKRRLDPETGEPREPTAETVSGEVVDAVPAADPVVEEKDPVAELTADLQRLSAEYANYRKRVDRDRVAVIEMATAGLLTGLLPVLDDIERARSHGDLTGAFLAVGEALEAATAKLGLETFGAPGEPFDPSVHEALLQAEPDPSATVATCAAVLQPGYRMRGGGSAGGRVLRAARVSVSEPGAPPAES